MTYDLKSVTGAEHYQCNEIEFSANSASVTMPLIYADEVT